MHLKSSNTKAIKIGLMLAMGPLHIALLVVSWNLSPIILANSYVSVSKNLTALQMLGKENKCDQK